MTDSETTSVSNVAFGGEGVLHTLKGVVFVHDTLPSESVSIKITQQKKRYSRGVLLSVEQPHPLRIAPKCPHFSVCGGCHLQHAHYSLQAQFKKRWLQESLQRIGGIVDVDVPALAPAHNIWEYRRYITLHLRVHDGSYRAFFHGREPDVAVQPMSCPIFSEASLKPLHETVARLEVHPVKNEEGRVQLMKIEGGRWLYTFHFRNSPRGAWGVLQELMQKDLHCAGVKLKTAANCETIGLKEGSISVSGLSFTYSPEAFVQTHPDQSEAIYTKIVEFVESRKGQKPQRILDLYGGIGVTASLLAREGARVTSVELNREAVNLAKRNFAANGLHQGKFWCGDVAVYLRQHDLAQFDLIIANPPREGISPKALKLIAASKKELLLISCMPTTLARDIKLLSQDGYQLHWVQGYDMFPQTTHFETIAVLGHSVEY
jgi:23S rRNA (uracil1939-C5)-methyltransferase